MADNLQPVGETHPLLEGWIFGISVALRRLIFFGTAAFLSLGGTLFFADLLNRLYGTLDGPAIVLIALFFVLFSMVSLGFTHALFGFFVAPIRGLNITSRLQSEDLQAGFDRTAIVIPVYNEPVAEVFERLRAELLPDVRWVAPQAGYLGWLDFGGLGLGDDPAKALLERGGSRTAAGPPSGPRGAASRGSTRAPRLPFSTRSCDTWCRVYRPSEATRGGDVRFDARHTVVLGSGFAWGHGVRGWVARKRAARGRGVVAGRRRAG